MDISFLDRTNFKAYDFFKSNTAIKNGILNIPKPYQMTKVLDNLVILANKTQEIRDFLGYPIYFSSAFRCLTLNRILKSKDSSQHPLGQANDWTCPAFGTPEEIVLAIKEKGIEVDQCLVEKKGKRSWVHLSIKEFNNRNQFAYLIDGVFTIIKPQS